MTTTMYPKRDERGLIVAMADETGRIVRRVHRDHRGKLESVENLEPESPDWSDLDAAVEGVELKVAGIIGAIERSATAVRPAPAKKPPPSVPRYHELLAAARKKGGRTDGGALRPVISSAATVASNGDLPRADEILEQVVEA
jgi:hypothetical protein